KALAGLGANNVNGKTDQALGANGSSAKAGVTAHVDDGAIITAGHNVGVISKERIHFDVLAGSGSAGAVGIGSAIGIVTIGSKVEAYIGAATVTAGSGASDSVTVNASLVSDVTGKAWGGQAGGVALGAQVIVVNDNSQQLAHIDSGAQILRAGGTVSVHA